MGKHAGVRDRGHGYGGDGIVSGWSGRERVGIGNIGNVFENLQKVKIFNIEYAIIQLSNDCSTALISLPNIFATCGTEIYRPWFSTL